MKISFFLLLPVVFVTGCGTLYGPQRCLGPSILQTGSATEIRSTAIANARADIAASKPRIAFTGGFACMAVGVPEEDRELIKNLPNVPLPCGCTEPCLEQAAVYAEAYNQEMLPYLLKLKNSDKNSL